MGSPLDDIHFRQKPVSQWLTEPGESPEVWQKMGEAVKALIQKLVEQTTHAEPAQRTQAVRALQDLGDPLQWVLPALKQGLKAVALEDADEGVRGLATEALSQHVGPHAGQQLSLLVDALRDPVPSVRIEATRALAELGTSGFPAVPPLIHAAQWDADPAVRTNAAVAIWKIDRRDRIVVPALMKTLRVPDECLRWVAADCLGDIGADAEDALPSLKIALAENYRFPMVEKAIHIAIERIESAVKAKSGSAAGKG